MNKLVKIGDETSFLMLGKERRKAKIKGIFWCWSGIQATTMNSVVFNLDG